MLRIILGVLCAVALLAVARLVAAAEAQDMWVEVRINGAAQADFAMVRLDLRGHMYARRADVRAWRITPPASAPLVSAPAPGLVAGSGSGDLVRIDDVPGLRAHLDEDGMVLHLDAAPALFDSQMFNAVRRKDAPEAGVPALFMDYNLFAEHAAAFGESYSALLQAGSSYGRASLTSSWLATRNGTARLDTDLLLDYPEYTARLILGDSVTNPGTLGQSLRFTGAHWATDYATQPGLTPYALPTVSGAATLPSSIELYVNNSLVQRTQIDAGPFELNNIPVPIGQGSVDIRMRDIQGQIQQLAVPYLVSPQLITAGLTVEDFSAGAVRNDYGIDSFAYGRGFLAGAVQHGLNDSVTWNTSAELVPDGDEVTVRGGAAARVARNVTVELTPAVSYASGFGAGAAVDAGVDAVWSSSAVGAHLREASPGYVELGNLVPGERLHTEVAAQASTQFGRWGSLGLLYAWRRSYGSYVGSTAAATLTYNLSLRSVGAIGAFVTDTHGSGVRDVIAGITFTRYLGRGVSASVIGTTDNGVGALNMQIGRPAPPDAGWGWYLAHASGGGVDTSGARIDARSAYGSGSAEVDSTQSGTLAIVDWQGGFLWAGGRPWPAQNLLSPAALVEVPDLGGVEVFHDGQPVGRTDSQGRIVVPGLRPFEDNTLTVVQEDLPPTAMIDADRIVVRPYSHGVVKAVLGVSAEDSVVFTLRLGDADFVPAGAEVAAGGHIFPVGTQGLAQLPVGKAATDAVASWPGGRCQVHLPTLLAAKKASPAGGALQLDCRKVH